MRCRLDFWFKFIQQFGVSQLRAYLYIERGERFQFPESHTGKKLRLKSYLRC